jgi:hypothetical protein
LIEGHDKWRNILAKNGLRTRRVGIRDKIFGLYFVELVVCVLGVIKTELFEKTPQAIVI